RFLRRCQRPSDTRMWVFMSRRPPPRRLPRAPFLPRCRKTGRSVDFGGHRLAGIFTGTRSLRLSPVGCLGRSAGRFAAVRSASAAPAIAARPALSSLVVVILRLLRAGFLAAALAALPALALRSEIGTQPGIAPVVIVVAAVTVHRRWLFGRVLLLGVCLGRGNNAEIMLRVLEIVLRRHRIARHLGITRQ